MSYSVEVVKVGHTLTNEITVLGEPDDVAEVLAEATQLFEDNDWDLTRVEYDMRVLSVSEVTALSERLGAVGHVGDETAIVEFSAPEGSDAE